jgi:ABC-type transport system substrate-binding protein
MGDVARLAIPAPRHGAERRTSRADAWAMHITLAPTMYSKGVQSFLKDADIDQWFEQQARERNRTKREELLHKIQQKVYNEAYFMPIWQLGFLCVTGPRVAVSGLGLIPDYIYSAPYEDVQMKASGG